MADDVGLGDVAHHFQECQKKEPIVPTPHIDAKAINVARPIRELVVTLLNLHGLDENKLTYYHACRYKQLSQFRGQVIKELIA